MLLRRHRRAETVCRLQRFRRLNLVRAIWHHRQHGIIGFLGFFHVPYGHRGRFHHLLLSQSADHIFRGGQMLHHLRYGPTVRSGPEVPLCVGQPFCRVEHTLLGRLQVLQRTLLLCLRNVLCLCRRRACQRQHHNHRYCVTSVHTCFLSLIDWVKERKRKIESAVRPAGRAAQKCPRERLSRMYGNVPVIVPSVHGHRPYLPIRPGRKDCFIPACRAYVRTCRWRGTPIPCIFSAGSFIHFAEERPVEPISHFFSS